MARLLSGIQSSGKPHLGNYLGAMRQHVAMQDKHACSYFIANYHALTTIKNGDELRKATHELALDYLALGLDPKKTVFFRQSDVPEHAELMWILGTIAPMGLLERAHAWKDAQAKGKKDITVGLFTYPVLMAADILLYQTEFVPVGQDQKQHVEIAKDLAEKFNHLFGATFALPEAMIQEDVAVVPGTDGQKMSKSYKNTIDIFADAGTLKKQVMSIKTDSKSVDEPKDPKTCVPFLLYKHFAEPHAVKEVELKLQEGGLGYGDLKKMLLDALLVHFAEARERRLELEKKPGYVEEVLTEGAKRAQKTARATLGLVRTKIGL